MIRLLATAICALALAIAGCGGDSGGTQPGSPQTTAGSRPEAAKPASQPKPQPKPHRPGTTVKVADSEFGKILFDGKKQAIYLFEKEASGKPECYGDCAAAWPPVLTEGDPVAADGAKKSLLGTTKRKDGATQVTYSGQPLYYYAEDGPGQVLCNNVSEFGGLWLVLDANGDALS